MTAPGNHPPADAQIRCRLRVLLDEHLDRADACAPDDPALEGHLAAALQLSAAIDRVDNGTYGICRRCKQSISRERIAAVPAAARCSLCTEARRSLLP